MKIKIKNSNISTLTLAIQNLDGVSETKLVQQPDGTMKNERTITTRYEYDSGGLKFAMGKNLRLLESATADIEKARQAIVKGLKATEKPDGQSMIEGEEFKKFQTQWAEVLEAETEIDGILPFKFDDLKSEKNNIPGEVICDLMDILVGGPTE